MVLKTIHQLPIAEKLFENNPDLFGSTAMKLMSTLLPPIILD